jgi:ABC-2 type transport system ATP-binding protein
MSDVMIEARGLTKRYGAVDAIRNVDFEVRRGEILGFLGPNGAGKTTTMKILTSFIAPTEGTAKVNGHDVSEESLEARRAIGYLPEHTPLYQDMLTYEYLEVMGQMRGLSREEVKPRIKKVVEATGLDEVIGKEIRALSKGYRQRVGLAQALIHEPPILILDEPMSGLDPNQAVEIRDLIKDIGQERTVVLSTHNLAEVQVTCNRVLIIAKGHIVADDTTEGLRKRAGGARFAVSLAREVDGKAVEPSRAREALARIDAVEHIAVASTDGGDLVVHLTPKDGADLRSSISKAVAEADLVLVGLSREEGDLESVFRDLTTQAKPAGANDGDSDAVDDDHADKDA